MIDWAARAKEVDRERRVVLVFQVFLSVVAILGVAWMSVTLPLPLVFIPFGFAVYLLRKGVTDVGGWGGLALGLVLVGSLLGVLEILMGAAWPWVGTVLVVVGFWVYLTLPPRLGYDSWGYDLKNESIRRGWIKPDGTAPSVLDDWHVDDSEIANDVNAFFIEGRTGFMVSDGAVYELSEDLRRAFELALSDVRDERRRRMGAWRAMEGKPEGEIQAINLKHLENEWRVTKRRLAMKLA